MGQLEGKVALITGGSRGIGLATAELFVQEGAKVVIVGNKADNLKAALAKLGSNATGDIVDISDLAALDHLYNFIAQTHGHLDIIVANAGICNLSSLVDATEDQFDRHFDTNTKGTFFTVQKSLPLLRDGATIVLISSIAQYKGVPGYHIYAGSKAAVRAFARNWALELKDRNIRVNCLSPGPTDTPMAFEMGVPTEALPAMLEQLQQVIPLGRLGRPSEQAEAILFLASDRSSFITGADLCTDGGMAQI